MTRDLAGLIDLNAVTLNAITLNDANVRINLEWPQQSSQSELLEQYEKMPPAVSMGHPAIAELSRMMGDRRRHSSIDYTLAAGVG